MPKSAQEESVRAAVSTINARQSSSEPPSTANTLWAGDDLGFAVLGAPLGRKKKKLQDLIHFYSSSVSGSYKEPAPG